MSYQRDDEVEGKGVERFVGSIRTMEEFSSYVGLSRPTVSKYFNSPGSVRESTRKRIEAALETSGFTPNLFATNLKRERTRVLGIIVPTTTDPFYMELVRCLEEIATNNGYFAFTLSSNRRLEREEEAIGRLDSMNIAGAVVIPLGSESKNVKLASLERRSPIIYVDSTPYADAPFVGTDNAQSIGLMVEHLCQTGEPPSFLPMPEINRNAKARLAAYEDAMSRAGEVARVLPAPDSLTWDFERYGHEVAAGLLKGGLPTSTIFCANDRMALGVQLAAWEAGVRVGRDRQSRLRVAGHDDHPFSRYACPPLTTVSQDVQRIAQCSMGNLLKLIGDRRNDGDAIADSTLLPGQLVLRDSA